MTYDELVERVARALSQSQGLEDGSTPEEAAEWWDGCEEPYRRMYRKDARAALAAVVEASRLSRTDIEWICREMLGEGEPEGEINRTTALLRTLADAAP